MNQSPNQSPEFVTLYRRAFADYGAQALWNMQAFDEPTPEDALAVARALRIEGDMKARSLAEQIEQACRAYQTHAGRRHGQWPSSPEIATAMFERYGKKGQAWPR